MFGRLAFTAAALLLCGACSLSGIGEAEPDPRPDAQDVLNAYATIRLVYVTLKLPGDPEVSSVHRNRGPFLAEWAMCVRNDAPDKQHYTFFFKNRKISEWRLSVIVDACETETFRPLPKP